MSKKLNVAVLMGGNSPEYKISLSSGREVVKNLNSKKYNILPIIISRDGQNWKIGESQKNLKFKIENLKLDLAFIAMHGPYGEDGTIQGFLELIGVPYTGSKVLASALGMDKIYSRKLFTQAKLKTPKFIQVEKSYNLKYILKKLNLPFFVKPNNQGSSIGTSIVKTSKVLKQAIHTAHHHSDIALVEEFIEGIEITCAIIGNDKPRALPLVEIIPKKEFFDYEAKYNERLCDEIIPARISKAISQKAKIAAISAYKSIGCRGFGRVDMIIQNNNIFVLEVNTIPGLTPVSLVPKAARAAGISYPKLLEKIITLAIP